MSNNVISNINATVSAHQKKNENVMICRVRQKSSPLKFFAVFSATAWIFNMEFYRFIYRNVLHLTAKWNMILLKNDEIVDFWTWLPTDFSTLKNV